MYKNDKVIRRYSEPFNLLILDKITPESSRTTLIFSSNSNQLEEKRISEGKTLLVGLFQSAH